MAGVEGHVNVEVTSHDIAVTIRLGDESSLSVEGNAAVLKEYFPGLFNGSVPESILFDLASGAADESDVDESDDVPVEEIGPSHAPAADAPTRAELAGWLRALSMKLRKLEVRLDSVDRGVLSAGATLANRVNEIERAMQMHNGAIVALSNDGTKAAVQEHHARLNAICERLRKQDELITALGKDAGDIKGTMERPCMGCPMIERVISCDGLLGKHAADLKNIREYLGVVHDERTGRLMSAPQFSSVPTSVHRLIEPNGPLELEKR